MMQFTSVFLATAYLFFTASANPIVARAQCSPDFGGRTLSLYNTAYGHLNESTKFPDTWRIDNSGSVYTIRNASDLNSVLTRNGGSLAMAPVSACAPDPNQQFNITCTNCQTGDKTGCTIQTTNDNPAQCVTSSPKPTWDLRVQQCTGAGDQSFEFESGTA